MIVRTPNVFSREPVRSGRSPLRHEARGAVLHYRETRPAQRRADPRRVPAAERCRRRPPRKFAYV